MVATTVEQEIAKKYGLSSSEMKKLRELSKTVWLRIDKLVEYIKKYPVENITEKYLSELQKRLMEAKKKSDPKSKEIANRLYVEYKVGEFCYFNTIITMKIKGLIRTVGP